LESMKIATILSVPFCPYHFVQYHFVRSPQKVSQSENVKAQTSSLGGKK